MKKFIVLLALCLGFAAQAQETYHFAERDTCSLYLDIYRPAAGSQTQLDSLDKPAIMYVFGGGFIMGERSHPWHLPWFRTLNENGYTVVTVDYRLGMKGVKVGKGMSGALQASDAFENAQQMGVEDVISAVTFLLEQKDSLGIDPYNMVISGSSAGAIISLATEYALVSGRAKGLPEDFNFKGVMSFAGGIISNSGAPHFPKAPCPILLLHGTADQAVQYKSMALFGKGIWGSSWLANDWKRAGYNNYCIYRFKDSTHDVAMYMEVLWDLEKTFLEQNVIRGHARSVDALVDDASLPHWMQISLGDIYK